MKKNREYQTIDELPLSVHDEAVAYQRNVRIENISVMPMADLLKHGMLLEESKRVMMEKIRKDFPDVLL